MRGSYLVILGTVALAGTVRLSQAEGKNASPDVGGGKVPTKTQHAPTGGKKHGKGGSSKVPGLLRVFVCSALLLTNAMNFSSLRSPVVALRRVGRRVMKHI